MRISSKSEHSDQSHPGKMSINDTTHWLCNQILQNITALKFREK